MNYGESKACQSDEAHISYVCETKHQANVPQCLAMCGGGSWWGIVAFAFHSIRVVGWFFVRSLVMIKSMTFAFSEEPSQKKGKSWQVQ